LILSSASSECTACAGRSVIRLSFAAEDFFLGAFFAVFFGAAFLAAFFGAVLFVAVLFDDDVLAATFFFGPAFFAVDFFAVARLVLAVFAVAEPRLAFTCLAGFFLFLVAIAPSCSVTELAATGATI
jgi:hypothetical protein